MSAVHIELPKTQRKQGRGNVTASHPAE